MYTYVLIYLAYSRNYNCSYYLRYNGLADFDGQRKSLYM